MIRSKIGDVPMCTAILVLIATLMSPGSAMAVTESGFTLPSDATTLKAVRTDGSVILGVSASGLRGISASGLYGISASGLRGISASGLYGISASGLRGISASGLYGNSASGLRGISASGLYGISASGLRGISASGLYGISASGLRGIDAQGQVENEIGNVSVAIAFGDLPLGVIGPVSMISKSDNLLTVLGQDIVLDSQTLVISVDEQSGMPDTLLGETGIEKLDLGDYLVVAGEIVEPGLQLGTVIIKLRQNYETGASLAYLRSTFTTDIALSASIKSGNSVVDNSGALFNPDLATASSTDTVEYFGFVAATNPNKLIANFGQVVNEEFD